MRLRDRFIYRTQGEYINPLSHIFFLVTLVFGLGFTFFGLASGAEATVLYQVTAAAFGTHVVSIWGIAALIVTALNTAMLATRKPVFAYLATFGGFGLWLYAGLTYLMGGFIFQFFAAALPNLLFWTWYYFAVVKYRKRVAAGDIKKI